MFDIDNALEIMIQALPNQQFLLEDLLINLNWREGVVYLTIHKDDNPIIGGRLLTYNEPVEIIHNSKTISFLLLNPYMTPSEDWSLLGSEIKLFYIGMI